MKVRLTQPHTHAGQAHPAGEVIELDPERARWLVETVGGAEYVVPPKKQTKGE